MSTGAAPRRVLHVTTVPITMMFNVGHAQYLARRGWEVHAACAPGPLLEEFRAQTGAHVHELPMTRQMRPAHDARALTAAHALMRRVRPHVVHAQSPKGALIGLAAARATGVPARFYGVLGVPADTAQGTAKRLLQAADAASCRLAHRVLCVSHSVRQTLVRERICAPGKAIVLGEGSVGGIDARDAFNPSTVDAETLARVRARLALPSGATVIGFVGRLEREKGVAELLEAFAALRRSRSRVHLVVLGNMEVKDRLPDAVLRTLREDTHVHWLSDYIDARELAAAYALMDVVALPSYREGFPSVLLEAAAMARPAVSTHVPGCSDAIVDGVTGTLVPVRDAAALASALARYLDDPPLREAHGDAARVRALADYAPERIWEQTLDEYDTVLGASARRLA